ncbi:MAG TPA: iron ABC transporter permease, partial [Methylomirabilota bacterium]
MLARRPARRAVWSWLAMGIAATLAVPIAAVVSSLAVPSRDIWVHLWRTQLVELVAHTLLLLLGVGVGTLIVGGGLAWLVVHHRFPGRSVL